ncbi:SpoIIE family protein phosphatase [Paenibacillus sp. PL2-23]|uniref:PP2C family protein-serine/threonine phosphatase n=1 Tax=Paenibacillus sp. PL2-23 TaxID=2100729 RepID=UPI0030FC2C12
MRIEGEAGLALRFLGLFGAGAALVLFWITMESLFIKRLTFAYLFEFSLPATLGLLAGMMVMLEGYVLSRFRRIARLSADRVNDDAVSKLLLRLPYELFWLTVAYALLFIPFYHVIHYAFEGHSFVQVDEYYRLNFVRSFLYELAISLTAAILHFAVARRLIRPALLGLTNAKGERRKGRSFMSMLTTAFCVLLLVNLLSILWYVLVARIKHHPIDIGIMAWIVGLELVFAASIYWLLASQFRRELMVLTDRLRGLLAGGRSEGAAMPILSDDETGTLAAAYNRLHEQMSQSYEELATELRLARQFQEQLLPPSMERAGRYAMAACSSPRTEVGSGFYDMIPLEGGRLAVVAGEVSGEGLPAALQMSALLLLLRAEIHVDGSPRSMLDRFNRSLADVFPKEARISAALAVMDAARGTVELAVEGAMSAWLSEGEGEPAGVVLNGEAHFGAGRRLVLYSEEVSRIWLEEQERDLRLHGLRADEELDRQLAPEWSRYREKALVATGDFTVLVIACGTEEEEAG